VVSCQFAMHYAFENEQRAKDFLGNVTHKLRPGGYFFGTTPDARMLYRRALASADGKTFGNRQYSVVFDEKVEVSESTSSGSAPAIASSSASVTDANKYSGGLDGVHIRNGQRYTFSLLEAVDNVAEYIVDPSVLVRWCGEFGLELVRMENFQEMLEYESSRQGGGGGQGSASDAPPSRGSLDDETWDTFGVYMVFVFKKSGRAQSTRHTCRRFPVGVVDPSRDLVILPAS